MPLPTLRVGWTLPRTWFVTARLLEVAAAVAILSWVLQSWQVFQSISQAFGANGEPVAAQPFLDRVTLFAMYGFGSGQMPFGGIMACILILGVLAVVHFARPVSHASLLRWEVLAIWVLAVLLNMGLVLSAVVAVVRGDPNAPGQGVVTFDGGPGFTELLLSGVTLPVLCLVLLAVAALWWLRLPVEFDEPADEPVREPRRWRPAPAQDANTDDLTLEGVELIEPVERLHPRVRGDADGSTASGYDDYFRRF
jgi:hypothetical protein